MTDEDDYTIFTRSGAVEPSRGRFCLLPKGHVGNHQADEARDWGPQQPPAPLGYSRYYPWYMGWWGFTPFGFNWSRFLLMLFLTMVATAFIFSATSSSLHTNCDTRIVTTGTYPDIETHSTL